MAWGFGDIVKLCVKRADDNAWGGPLDMKLDDNDDDYRWELADVVVAWFPVGLSVFILLLLILLTS